MAKSKKKAAKKSAAKKGAKKAAKRPAKKAGKKAAKKSAKKSAKKTAKKSAKKVAKKSAAKKGTSRPAKKAAKKAAKKSTGKAKAAPKKKSPAKPKPAPKKPVAKKPAPPKPTPVSTPDTSMNNNSNMGGGSGSSVGNGFTSDSGENKGSNEEEEEEPARVQGDKFKQHVTYLKEGDKAPYFSGVDQKGNKISLDDFEGKTVILFFYPKDDTEGCTKEACSLRDEYRYLNDSNYAVIGVSADDLHSHDKFANKYNLPYPLIADTDMKIIKAYDVWGQKMLAGHIYDGIVRTTFIIDAEGYIKNIITKVDTANHAKQILSLETA